MGTKIRSIGYQFPAIKITNDIWRERFAPKTKLMSNEFTRFISEGVKERYYMRPEDTVDQLAAGAAIDCLQRIDASPESVQHIIHMSNVPDTFVNGEGPKIQHRIGARHASTVDLTGVSCAGFILGLNMATALIHSGTYDNVMLICVSNVGTRAADHRDVSAATLGDLATAILIEKADGASGNLGFVHQTRGEYYHVHVHKALPDGKRTWAEDESKPWGKHFFFIDPREGVPAAQKGAQEYAPQAARMALARANTRMADIKWFITHQPGLAPMRLWDQLLGVDRAKHPHTLDEIGNSSFCTIPFTLRRTLDKGGVDDGDLLLLMTPSSGQHAAALVWRW